MQALKFSALFATLLAAQLQEGGAPSGGSPANDSAKDEVKVPDGMKAQTFHFRKEKVTDEEGNILETKKHPSVMIPLPIPTREEISAIFADPAKASEQKYVLDLVSDAYYVQAREQINAWREDPANKGGTVSANVIDYSKLNLTELANMPASERGNKVSDEDMLAFLADYVAIMPQVSGRDASKVKAQAGILEKGLRTVKTDKKVLEVMKGLLQMWANATESLEEHQQAYEMLYGRADRWLKAEPKNVLDSIM